MSPIATRERRERESGYLVLILLAESFNPDDKPDDELPDWVEDEKANFDLVLDANQDGRLDSSEIRQWIVPDEDTMYRVETKHLFYNADANRVGVLNLGQRLLVIQ